MLVRSYPFADFLTLERDLDRLVARTMGFGRAVAADVNAPLAIAADADGVSVRAELPGVDPAAVSIAVENQVLTISAERKPEERKNGQHHVSERRSGTFSQSLRLADDLDPEAITASADNGVLTVRIPKRPQIKPRQIEVKVS
jgi:HSP20 family protein